MKRVLLFILFTFVITLSSFSQKKYDLQQIRKLISFDNFIDLRKGEIGNLWDTIPFLEVIIDYYSDIDINHDTRYICYYGRDWREANYYIYEDGSTSGNKWEFPICDVHLKNFTVLFYIENEIVGHSDTVRYIQTKRGKQRVIDGIIDTSKKPYKRFAPDYYKQIEKERKEITKIYKYYEKWLNIVKKHGLDYVRKNNIRPLDKTKYEWKS